jgi:membrane-associated protease RseP (regulator of RpoE activity)
MGRPEYIFSALSILVALVTSFLYSVDTNSLNPAYLQSAVAAASATATAVDGVVSEEAMRAAEAVIGRVLPIAFGLVGLQVFHDLGHNIMASVHKVKLSWPYFLPSLQIGLFGSITNFLSFPKTRKEMFDVSIAGPTLGFIASLAVTLFGLTMTASATPEVLSTFPALPTGFFSTSLLLHELVNAYIPLADNPAATAVTYIHPLVAVGLTGILANAFNFMPIGRLDGGRVATAIAGRQGASNIAFITLLGQAVSFITSSSPVSFFWILLVVFLQRGQDIPPEDDFTPVATDEEDQKKGLAWFGRALALAFCVLLTAGTILQVPAPFELTSALTGAAATGAATGADALQGIQGLIPKPFDI